MSRSPRCRWYCRHPSRVGRLGKRVRKSTKAAESSSQQLQRSKIQDKLRCSSDVLEAGEWLR